MSRPELQNQFGVNSSGSESFASTTTTGVKGARAYIDEKLQKAPAMERALSEISNVCVASSTPGPRADNIREVLGMSVPMASQLVQIGGKVLCDRSLYEVELFKLPPNCITKVKNAAYVISLSERRDAQSEQYVVLGRQGQPLARFVKGGEIQAINDLSGAAQQLLREASFTSIFSLASIPRFQKFLRFLTTLDPQNAHSGGRIYENLKSQTDSWNKQETQGFFLRASAWDSDLRHGLPNLDIKDGFQKSMWANHSQTIKAIIEMVTSPRSYMPLTHNSTESSSDRHKAVDPLTSTEIHDILKNGIQQLKNTRTAADLYQLAKDTRLEVQPVIEGSGSGPLFLGSQSAPPLAQFRQGNPPSMSFHYGLIEEYYQKLVSSGHQPSEAKQVVSERIAPVIGHELAHLKTAVELNKKGLPWPPLPIREDEEISYFREAAVYGELKHRHPEDFRVPLRSLDSIKYLAQQGGSTDMKMRVHFEHHVSNISELFRLGDIRPPKVASEVVAVSWETQDIMIERDALRRALTDFVRKSEDPQGKLEEIAEAQELAEGFKKKQRISEEQSGSDSHLMMELHDLRETEAVFKDASKRDALIRYYQERRRSEKKRYELIFHQTK